MTKTRLDKKILQIINFIKQFFPRAMNEEIRILIHGKIASSEISKTLESFTVLKHMIKSFCNYSRKILIRLYEILRGINVGIYFSSWNQSLRKWIQKTKNMRFDFD